MTTQILRHEHQQLQAWPMHNTWMSARSSSAWSHGGRLVTDGTDSSWEVRAFAEDASSNGQWPPRSYSCSFCQREFRTAQALGGHMNVHRRERAHQNQLAQLRQVRVTSKALSQPATTTVDLLSPIAKPESISLTNTTSSATAATIASLSSSPPSQESINSAGLRISTTKSFLNPDILSPRRDRSPRSPSWSPSRAGHYHPYEKPSTAADSKPATTGAHGRFSLCLNKVMGEVHEDALVDLELRLGRSSCAI